MSTTNSSTWQEYLRTAMTGVALYFLVSWMNEIKSDIKELIQIGSENRQRIILLEYRMSEQEKRSGVTSTQYIDAGKPEDEYYLPKKKK